MPEVTFRKSGPSLTESDIEIFQTRTGLVLPRSYAAFLFRHNGGIPRPSGYSLVNDPEPKPGADFVPQAPGLLDFLSPRRRQLERDFNEFQQRAYVPQRVQCLYPLSGRDPLSVEQVWRNLSQESEWWPTTLLPIGEGESGYAICVSLDERRGGAIYLWHDEDGAETEALDDCLLGSDIDDFLNRLFPARILYAPGYEPPAHVRRNLALDDYNE